MQTLKGRVDHGGLSPEEAAAERQTLDRIVTDLEREGHDAFEHLIRLPGDQRGVVGEFAIRLFDTYMRHPCKDGHDATT